MSHSMTGSLWLVVLIATIFVLSESACVKLSHRPQPSALRQPAHSFQTGAKATPPININKASAEEIERLPGIGRALAARIVSHREQYGSFRRPEHLIMVRGIGDRRFRRLRPLITVE